MPYIVQERRKSISEIGDIDNAGELNWYISELIGWYIEQKGYKYATLNEAIGVLEAVKLELYGRVVRPYELFKQDQNGDLAVYEALDRKLDKIREACNKSEGEAV
ncbi:MAG TPA: hypothetical protein VKA31_11295 [Mariprofundaceae bacterium]|nr:hypothetical protein [Mariprofundaceae bacterium]